MDDEKEKMLKKTTARSWLILSTIIMGIIFGMYDVENYFKAVNDAMTWDNYRTLMTNKYRVPCEVKVYASYSKSEKFFDGSAEKFCKENVYDYMIKYEGFSDDNIKQSEEQYNLQVKEHYSNPFNKDVFEKLVNITVRRFDSISFLFSYFGSISFLIGVVMLFLYASDPDTFPKNNSNGTSILKSTALTGIYILLFFLFSGLVLPFFISFVCVKFYHVLLFILASIIMAIVIHIWRMFFIRIKMISVE